MEFFTVSCLRRGRVSIDGSYLGENRSGDTLRVFQCSAGLHDVSLECLTGRQCRVMTQRVMITGTNAILPIRIYFVCDLMAPTGQS
ncbi:MAG TPA: hypothetical protein VJ550_04290 [Geomonas sp.]|nr:hypothetical protein [Geomonas sp.]